MERPTISAIIHSVSPRTVRWAAVHKVPDPEEDDPYYHVEVIEKGRGTPPRQFERLATHVVVTAEALNRSRPEADRLSVRVPDHLSATSAQFF